MNKLKILKIFARQEVYWGIPSRIFVSIFLGSLGFGVITQTVFIPLILFIFLAVTMHTIHKSDNKALEVWIRGIRQPYSRWAAGRSVDTKLIIIRRE